MSFLTLRLNAGQAALVQPVNNLGMIKATETQVGGTHYKGQAYQVVDVAAEANLNFFQANILKYVGRYKGKDGTRDLKKAIHYAELGQQLVPQNGAIISFAHTYSERNGLTPTQADLVYSVFNQDWPKIIQKVKYLLRAELEKELTRL